MKVSVVIATYNTADYLPRAIRSCYNQSLDKRSFEVIVVNDGSNDGTRTTLIEASRIFDSDMNFKVISLQPNSGVGLACNEGFSNAKAHYVMRLDSDDWMSEKTLEILSLFLDWNKEYDAVACDYLRVDDRENIIAQVNCEEHPIDCGVMYRKDSLGIYSQNRSDNQEISRGLKVLRVPLPLYRYRIREGSLTWKTPAVLNV